MVAGRWMGRVRALTFVESWMKLFAANFERPGRNERDEAPGWFVRLTLLSW